ncbi:hypothetical protein KPL78_23075 [Roseomonas sp. HJA6]|uniref:Uncharacterized protein n=1 Tax=Roseomonas alba TaxID=2846776 RepID=A0ABS7AEM9_9PROT|nr:hypothetical protein [Neoroseomonas alba]MBW6400762.1 hypothetical protein [Neoroseomonas alba]
MDDHLTPANPADIEEAIHYALRFGSSGKPLAKGTRVDAKILARSVTEQLLRSNFLIFRRRHEPGPTPGRCGEPPNRSS